MKLVKVKRGVGGEFKYSLSKASVRRWKYHYCL